MLGHSSGVQERWPARRSHGPSVKAALLTTCKLVASAAMLAIANEGAWPIAAVAYVPWIHEVWRRDWRFCLLACGLLTLLMGFAVACWLPEALRSLGVAWIDSLVWTLLAILWGRGPLSLCFGLAVWLCRGFPIWGRVSAPALVLALAEALASRMPLALPWAFLGHSQIDSAGVAQLAIVGGVPGISGLLAALNLSIAASMDPRARSARRTALALGMAWIALAGGGLEIAHAIRGARGELAPSPPLALLAIQPEIERGERWSPGAQAFVLDRLLRATERSLARAKRTPDLVVWPENALTLRLDRAPELRRRLDSQIDRWDVPLVGGFVRAAEKSSAPSSYRSSILWWEPMRGLVAQQDKERGVPLLEAEPDSAPTRLLSRWLAARGRDPRLHASGISDPLSGELPLAAVLCFEGLFPEIVARRRSDRWLVLIQLADESWTASARARRGLATAIAFRAIEQRMPVLRVIHGGPSSLIDAFGRPLQQLPVDAWDSASFEVTPSPPASAVEKSAILALPALVAGLVLALARRVDDRRDARGEPDCSLSTNGQESHLLVVRWKCPERPFQRRTARKEIPVQEEHPALLAARASWRCAQAHDKQGWLDLMTDDVCIEDPIGVAITNPTGEGVRGKQAASEFWDKTIAPSQISIETHESRTAGHESAHLLSLTTRLENGMISKVRGFFVYVVDERGKLTNLRGYWDMDDMSFEPPPG
jgi:steroid delta-isomerase